jgi:hypothetical protein
MRVACFAAGIILIIYQEKIERSAEALWDCQTQYLSLQIKKTATIF